MIKGIVFDLDGTLVDTLVDLMNAVNYMLKSYNFKERTLDEIRSFVGNGVDVLVERALPSDKKDLKDEALSIFSAYYKVHAMDNIAPYDGIFELLNKLKELNIKMACVTNKIDAVAKDITARYFSDTIDFTIGHQTTLNKKPHPDMCNKALSLLNLSNEDCIYVGDSEVDYQTAVNSNLRCISVSWGFRTKEYLQEIGAKTIIDKPLELLNYLNK